MLLPVAVATARYKHAQWNRANVKIYDVLTRARKDVPVIKSIAAENFIGHMHSFKITVKTGPPKTTPTGPLATAMCGER